MAVRNYGICDQWTNLDKLNNVDIKSVDGVVESVKINGVEAGGGGSKCDTASNSTGFVRVRPITNRKDCLVSLYIA